MAASEIVTWINANGNIISIITTILLLMVTAIYAYVTKKILDSQKTQIKLQYSPIIGIHLTEFTVETSDSNSGFMITPHFGLSNLGNAPAMDIMIDCEIILYYTKIRGNNRLPCSSHYFNIPFIKSNEELDRLTTTAMHKSIYFGDIVYDQLIEERIEWIKEHNEANKLYRLTEWNAPKFEIHIYYSNHLGQMFASRYRIYLNFKQESLDYKKLIIMPSCTLMPEFISHPIEVKKVYEELNERSRIRNDIYRAAPIAMF